METGDVQISKQSSRGETYHVPMNRGCGLYILNMQYAYSIDGCSVITGI